MTSINCTDEHLQLVTDCENRTRRLTEWERTFIASVREQLTYGRSLSAKQIETLDETWERATAKG